MRSKLSLLLIFFVGVVALSAKTPRPAPRSAGGKKAVVSASAKKNTGKKASAKRSSTKGRRTVQTARRPPRQSAPTPERYTEIQQVLADKGYYTGPVNGTWGPDSVGALKRFQADQKLSADGKLGALSLIALGLGPKRESISQFAGKPESNP